MNLEQPFLPSNNSMMSPQNMQQPSFVGHQMGGGSRQYQNQRPPPLVSQAAQQFGAGGGAGGGGMMRNGGYMSQAPPQQQIPEHLMPQFEHPNARPPQGVPMNRGGNAGRAGISGVPNQNHRNIPQSMLKNQYMVNENMPGYAPQMFDHGSQASPLGASINGRSSGTISNNQPVNFQPGISQGIHMKTQMGQGGWGTGGQGVIRNYPQGGGQGGMQNYPQGGGQGGMQNYPRQMSGFDRNRRNFQTSGGNNAPMTPIDFVGFNAQGEKVYDVQYYQNTPGRQDTAQFYAQYKKNPQQPCMPSNAHQNASSYMGYNSPPPQQVGGGRGRGGGGAPPMRVAPLNQRNLRNFQSRGRARGGSRPPIQGGHTPRQ